MFAQPGVGLADGWTKLSISSRTSSNDSSGQEPEVVFDCAVVWRRTRVGEDVEAAVGAASRSPGDDAWQEGIESGRKHRVMPAGGPLSFQVLQRGHDTERLLMELTPALEPRPLAWTLM